jgi:1,4-dihydroxy-2-naphthoate octaprenyltransferase
MVFGAMGVFGYLGYLAYDVFAHSMLFPFVLSGIGLLVILAGVVYQRNSRQIESRVLGAIPRGLRELLPTERAGMSAL